VPGTNRCLQGAAQKDIHTSHREQRRTLKERQVEEKTEVEDLLGRQGCISRAPWGTPCCGSAHQRCSSRGLSSPPWRPCAVRLGSGQTAPNTRRLGGPGPGEAG
jgi:hypothetical protein